MEFKSARINVLHISVEVITISVSIRQHEPILHGRQLGDYSPNQVASSKILGAMATKMVATWRVDFLLAIIHRYFIEISFYFTL